MSSHVINIILQSAKSKSCCLLNIINFHYMLRCIIHNHLNLNRLFRKIQTPTKTSEKILRIFDTVCYQYVCIYIVHVRNTSKIFQNLLVLSFMRIFPSLNISYVNM